MLVVGEDPRMVHPPPSTFSGDWRKYGRGLGSEASETTVFWSGLNGGRERAVEFILSARASQLQRPASPPTSIYPMTSAFCRTPAESLGSFTQADFWASSLAYRLLGVGLCIFKNHPQIMLCQTKGRGNHNKPTGIIKGHGPGEGSRKV